MRPSHDAYFLQMLALVASRSTCPRRSVGAILVSDENVVLATGYNGVPRGFDHCTEHPCPGVLDEKGETSRCHAVHAEVNAVLQCSRLGDAATLYVSCTPCFSCAKMIANTGIRRIVVLEEYADRLGLRLLESSGISVEVMTP